MLAKCPSQLQSWSERTPEPELSSGHVDVSRVRLDGPVETTSVRSILSSDELDRADRFHFERTACTSLDAARRCAFCWARTSQSTVEIHFVYQTSGEPELAVQQNPRGLRFNVSHSSGLATPPLSSRASSRIRPATAKATTYTVSIPARKSTRT
jgi:hypothetical protein